LKEPVSVLPLRHPAFQEPRFRDPALRRVHHRSHRLLDDNSGFPCCLAQLSLRSLPEGRRRPLSSFRARRNLTPVKLLIGLVSLVDPRRELVACFSASLATAPLTISRVAPAVLRQQDPKGALFERNIRPGDTAVEDTCRVARSLFPKTGRLRRGVPGRPFRDWYRLRTVFRLFDTAFTPEFSSD